MALLIHACVNFSNLVFFMSGTISDKFGARCCHAYCLHNIHAYIDISLKLLLLDISRSNSPILMKFFTAISAGDIEPKHKFSSNFNYFHKTF